MQLSEHAQRVRETLEDAEWRIIREPITWWAEKRPDVGQPTCVACQYNVADFDQESQEYGHLCGTCFWVGTSGPKHVHKYKDVKAKTQYRSEPIFDRPGIQCGWYCSECQEVSALPDFTQERVERALLRMFARYDRS